MSQTLEDKDRLLADLVIAEHQTFWAKFTAFSALNAGLLVVAFSTESNEPYIAIFGALLSAFWVLIQWLSYSYVCYYGDKFDELVVRLGVRDAGGSFWAGFVRPTFVAVCVAALVFLFWAERIYVMTTTPT